jgi:hypothetical protein
MKRRIHGLYIYASDPKLELIIENLYKRKIFVHMAGSLLLLKGSEEFLAAFIFLMDSDPQYGEALMYWGADPFIYKIRDESNFLITILFFCSILNYLIIYSPRHFRIFLS